MGAPACPLDPLFLTYKTDVTYPAGGAGNYTIPYNANVGAGFIGVLTVLAKAAHSGETGPFDTMLSNIPTPFGTVLPQQFLLSAPGGASAFMLTINSYDWDPSLPNAGYHVTFGAQAAPSDTQTVMCSLGLCDGTTQPGPQAPDLGVVEPFAILAGTAFDDAWLSNITGDVGVAGGSGAALTGLTCAELVGQIYTTDGAGGPWACRITDPALLAQASLDAFAAFNYMTALTPDVGKIDIGAGTLAGQTLGPGTYYWNTALNITSDIWLSGGPGSVFVFRVAGDFNVHVGENVQLVGGVLPENIFWAVIGDVDLRNGAHCEGTIISSATVNTRFGSTLNGRIVALVSAAINASTIIVP